MLTTANTKTGAMARLGGPTAENEGSTEVCGQTERKKVVLRKKAGTLTAVMVETLTRDMLVSPLQRAQAQHLAAIDSLTGAARWKMMR